ncbi:MAG: PQQ-binding-like beta-propeller repeat protein [Acidobacteria bacterium]|nr:PQQ-binding-like beta-propeller repeat protein [Acidobacteriota bacterium]
MRTVFTIVVLSCCAWAEDWPRFHGPNGAGVSASSATPVEFGAGKKMVWKTAVPFSRSSPIVAGGRVYLTAYENNNLITMALDAGSGRVLWRNEISRPTAKQPHKSNDPASPTPASDGRNVYAFFPDFGLVSYDAQGKERWRVTLGPFDSFYGLASSPVISGDTLLLNCDARSKAFLLAVDTRNGRTRWRAERKEIRFEGYTTPVVYKPANQPEQVVVWGPQRVDAYQVSTGERVWYFTGLSTYPIASPVISGDLLIGSSFGMDAPMPTFDSFLEKLDKDKDGRLSKEELKGSPFDDDFGAVDLDSNGYMERAEYDPFREAGNSRWGMVAMKLGGRGDVTPTGVAWQEKKTWPNLSTAVVLGGTLYFSKGGGIIVSVDAQSGKTLKAGRAKDAIEEHWASPVAAGGKLYFVSASGKVNVLKAAAEWEVMAVNDLNEEVFATPAIADNRIFIRTRGAVYCFGVASK